jgi:hypothetical protein
MKQEQHYGLRWSA